MRCGRPILLIARLGSAVLLAASCSTKVVAPEAPAPVANSPVNVVKRLEWAINRKDVEAVRGLLADDFVFVGAGVDSAGNPEQIGPDHDRDWFLAALAAFFDRSSSVRFTLDENLVPFPDSRPGRDTKVHKQVRTAYDLPHPDGELRGRRPPARVRDPGRFGRDPAGPRRARREARRDDVVAGSVRRPDAGRVWPRGRAHQIVTRTSSPRYMTSPGLMPNAA